MEPTILVREGVCFGNAWKQFLVITDQRVAVVEMERALFGWNLRSVQIQGAECWPGMDRAAIVAWKMHNDDGMTRLAGDLGDFRARLLTVASEGKV